MTRVLAAVHRRLPAIGLLVGLFAVLAPQPAWALPGIGDCKPAPTPAVPGRGVTAFFGRPNQPVPANPGNNLYESYDLAGMSWWTYDLGCGGGARDLGATVDTFLANGLFELPKLAVAATNGLTEESRQPTFLGIFDPLLRSIPQQLTNGVGRVWMPVTLALVAVMILWSAHRGQTARSVSAVGWALLVVVAAATLVRWPVEAGHGVDRAIEGSLGAVDRSIGPGQSASSAVGAAAFDAVLYRQWLSGELGSADSATAVKYGPQLLDATALTWQQARILDAAPDAGKKIIEDKQKAFKDLADKIEDEDPDAYAHLQGKTADRFGQAILSTLSAAFVLPFLAMSGLLLFGAFLIIRFVVMIFPLLAVVGLMQPASGIVRGAGRVVAAAAVNSVIFGVLSAVAAKIIGLEMGATELSGWVRVALALVTTIALWLLSKPFRSLTRMVSPSRNVVAESLSIRDDLQRVRRGVFRAGGMLLAARIAGRTAGRAAAEHDHDGPGTLHVPSQRGRYEAAPTVSNLPPAPELTTPPGTDLAPPARWTGWHRRPGGLPPAEADIPAPPPATAPPMPGRPGAGTYVEAVTGEVVDSPARPLRTASVGPDGSFTVYDAAHPVDPDDPRVSRWETTAGEIDGGGR